MLSQRLSRLLCPTCSRPLHPNNNAARQQLTRFAALTPLSFAVDQVREPVGDVQYHGSGYKGRIAIAELITTNDDLRQAVLRRADPHRAQDPDPPARREHDARNAGGYLTESIHGAGQPQAQRIQIARSMQIEFKKELAKTRHEVRIPWR
ncbi:hypothetical protein CP49_37685 [Bradyrhizobium valentinum]|uniref:Bacterial type II secretion system protein E domain-containing protein n=1 Tax=Bradyrhizobium valentinum TaxID=1518501 RepID=A0A0R3L388_9BRAD|nr:hypothetical protein CP49_37685 [Bradyrhizobium valentinum]